jgi:N-acetyl-1-D-myo-inositol-2-amino-2-deoxy-alpha-D-glucopyranoside deacetylase
VIVTEAAKRRALFVHAHPDDETISNAATMARYAAEGAHVALVTCTLGELGEVLVPELTGLAAEAADQLGGYRLAELQRAMHAVGVADFRLLGGVGRYRDSGMMGLSTNDDPRCFWQADLDEAAALLVQVIREMQPQVVVTYDENGGYGHPDHIQTHRVTMRAVELAADTDHGTGQPWQVPKVYWTAIPKSVLARGIEVLRSSGAESPFGVVETVDDLPFGTPDELVTTQVDGSAFAAEKDAALRAHATQISVQGPFFALSNHFGREVLCFEHYILVRGERGSGGGENGWEQDLFGGLS